jgi:uncharacterized protein YrrD
MDASTTATEVRRAREILSMPVYSIAEGKLLGSIDRLFVSNEYRQVPLLRIGKSLSTWHAFLPFSAIQKLGIDIVLVDAEASLLEHLTEQESKELHDDLPGRPIVTQSGERIGQVAGFSVQEGTGLITSLRMEIDTGLFARLTALGKNTVEIPVAMLQALGQDAVIVHNEVKDLHG